MSHKLKMHAKKELSYDPQTSGPAWTECFRHVEQSQLAAFVPSGVTCKRCLAILTFRAECDAEWAARRAQPLLLSRAEGAVTPPLVTIAHVRERLKL